ALEVALAGDSWWDRVKAVLAKGDEQAFRRQVRAFLDAAPLASLPGPGDEFRKAALRELRAARKKNLFSDGDPEAAGLPGQRGRVGVAVAEQVLLAGRSSGCAPSSRRWP